MDNEEMYDGLKDVFHDALEETILDIDSRMDKKNKVLEDKIDDVCFVLKDLVKVLNELV